MWTCFFFLRASLNVSEIKEIEQVKYEYDRLTKNYFFQSSIIFYKSWNPLKFKTILYPLLPHRTILARHTWFIRILFGPYLLAFIIYSEDTFSGSHSIYDNNLAQGWSGGNMGACPLRLEEIDGLRLEAKLILDTTDWSCDYWLTAQV